MAASKKIGAFACIAMVVCLVISLLVANGPALGIKSVNRQNYEDKIFDNSYVHDIQIVIDDWDEFCKTAREEEYSVCDVIIDGHKESKVGIRAKGNNSLQTVSEYGNNRYSLKIEFDHYKDGNTYYGLDKLCLNNIVNDATYMKDYLSYQMMNDMGVPSPLTSYAFITVNGEDWGLFLAVEAIEDAFLERNFGGGRGELYKPDTMDFKPNDAGMDFKPEGREEFNPEQFKGDFDPEKMEELRKQFEEGGMPDFEGGPQNQGGGGRKSKKPGGFGGFGGMGGDATKLIYTDDNPESYSEIRESAKTDVSDADFERLMTALKNMNAQTNLEKYLDTDEIIRYFAVHDFLVSGDSYTGSIIHNYYLYEEDGKLSMLPWDYNDAFGTFMGGGMPGEEGSESNPVNSDIDNPVDGGYEDRPMLAWILDSEEYREQYHEILRDFIDRWYTSGKTEKFIDETMQMIAPYVEKDPTAFVSYEAFEKGVGALKQFCMLRFEAIERQMDGDYTPVDTTGFSYRDTAARSQGGFDRDRGGFNPPPDFGDWKSDEQ